MKKTIVIIIIIISVTGLGWQIYKKATGTKKGPSARQKVAPVAVEIAPVERISLRDTGQFTGSLLPTSQFIIAPKVAGRLERLSVHAGDTVRRGHLIAVLDDEEFIQQVEQARAELEVVKASLEESRRALEISGRELERTIALREKKIISQSELDAQAAENNREDAKYKVALAQIAQKEAALKAAEVRLSYTRIHVSWETGNETRAIGERFVDEGALLQANSPIVSVIDISHLLGVIHVTEKDYLKIRVGQGAVITTDALPGKNFSGKIIRISPILKETAREARVDIEIPNPGGLLKPGMFVRIQIEFERHDNVKVVPFASVIRRDNKDGVFLVDFDSLTVSFIPVELGIVKNELAEIPAPELSGHVVTLGQHLLHHGSSIVLPDKKNPASIKEKRHGQQAD